jgi:hypothetical protein
MSENDIMLQIESYLTGKISDEKKQLFIEQMKEDVELLKKVEIERGLAKGSIDLAKKKELVEKKELKNRFYQKYEDKEKAGKLVQFSKKEDDKIMLAYMNAAFAKNEDILANDSGVIEWETIVKFLEGKKRDCED